MSVLHATNANFDKEVLQSSIPVLVDFWAEWCNPCKMIGPIIDEIETEMADKIKVVKVNIDEAADIAGKYNVMSIPTIMVFKGGQIANQTVGVLPKEALMAKVNEVL
ncbi:MAG: thioredoxin [Candidatus Omnitrophica bacterium]|nr:thioredoxin [Candidatus Omnitrophota bacterium]